LAYNGKVNILPYFLVLNTIIDFCEENEVLVGPGRGSAAGCLLSYALGITSTDPIIEDLSFERFFDVTRVEEGLADIDTDFSDRTKVVDFIKSFWGDKFTYLGIATTFKTKSALKDIDRFLHGEVRKVTEDICKGIPGSPQGSTEEEFLRGFTDADGVYHTGELENNERFVEYLNDNPKAAEFLFKMVGIVRQMGRHAAGVLIADRPIHEFIPIMQVSKEPTTQLLPKWVEKCGGIKYDILGLNTLEDIRICLKHIKQRHGISIDPWKIKDDPDFWEAAINNPVTVFQLHTATVRDGLQTMRPKNVQEAAILTSVFRPGAMDAKSDEDPTKNMSDIFLERWTGKRAVKMIHPDLEPILGPTKGIVVYQEQIMRIVHELGGLTMPETNKLRKAISKKEGDDLKKLLQKVKEWLIVSRGWTEAQAESIVSQMKASGRYCFNKSHAVAYCYIARACAYLKHYYPIEWWTAVLSNSSDDDLQANWQHNASITLPPNINTSAAQFSILPNEQILSPLSLVKGVAAAVMSELLEKRPFTSLEDMLRKVDRRVIHKGVMLKLILSGTLNQFFPADAGDVEKMQIFLNTKALIEGSSSPETVPDEYRNLTPLKNFLIKKSVFKVYTEHLASIAILKLEAMGIASRVTEGANSWVVNVKNDYYGNGRRSIVSLSRLEEFMESDKAHRFAVIAYITKTEEKPYADNKKNRLIVNAEIDNKSFEFIKWPGWKQNTHGINEDIEDSVCVLVLSKREGSDEGIFIDELTVIENLNFLKEKKDVEQKPKSKRTKKKAGSSDEHSESGP
jgi:DNA polymerase-3 subunit alpha